MLAADYRHSPIEWIWNGPFAIIAAEGDAAMSDVDQKRTSGGQTDVAALGSGVVGVAVAILIQPGAFNPVVAVVAFTLGLVIVSYIGIHRRAFFQRLAFASVMGVLSIPMVGMAFEPNWSAKESKVTIGCLMVGWLLVGLITLSIDTLYQRRLKKLNLSE